MDPSRSGLKAIVPPSTPQTLSESLVGPTKKTGFDATGLGFDRRIADKQVSVIVLMFQKDHPAVHVYSRL